jgi:hypothetical protein
MKTYVPRHAIGHRGGYGRGATWYVNTSLSDTRKVSAHIAEDAARRYTMDAIAEYGFAGNQLKRPESRRIVEMTQAVIARNVRNLLDSIEMLP